MDQQSTDRQNSVSSPDRLPTRHTAGGRRRRLLLVCGVFCLPAVAAYLFMAYEHACEARALGRIQELGGEVSSATSMMLLPGLATDSIINQCFAWLTTRDRLNAIEIPGQPVTDDDVTLFVDVFPCVGRMNLSATEISDDSLVALATLSRLQRLDVSSTQVTDAGLVQLHQSNSLRLLITSDTPTTGAGAEALEDAIPGCIVLR